MNAIYFIWISLILAKILLGIFFLIVALLLEGCRFSCSMLLHICLSFHFYWWDELQELNYAVDGVVFLLKSWRPFYLIFVWKWRWLHSHKTCLVFVCLIFFKWRIHFSNCQWKWSDFQLGSEVVFVVSGFIVFLIVVPSFLKPPIAFFLISVKCCFSLFCYTWNL